MGKHSSGNHIQKKDTRKKGKNKTKVILLSVLAIILFIIVAAGSYVFSSLGKMNKVSIKKDTASLGIDKNLSFDKDIINIAFLGVDSREGDVGRSDATMVLTVDKKHNKVKLTSLFRDSYVSIDGHGQTKLNHAYAYGGPQLSIKTINQNFGLDIKDFVKVDFAQLSQVIDALGGVEITIKDYEVNQVNKYINDVAKETKQTAQSVSVGKQLLNGVQAVGYSRVRYAGNGDIERTERQRTVLNAIFEKIKSAGVSQYPGIVSKLLPYVTTSMSSTDIISLGISTLQSGLGNLEQMEFPLPDKAKGQIINKVWYWVFDIEANKKLVRDYIFNDVKPQ